MKFASTEILIPMVTVLLLDLSNGRASADVNDVTSALADIPGKAPQELPHRFAR